MYIHIKTPILLFLIAVIRYIISIRKLIIRECVLIVVVYIILLLGIFNHIYFNLLLSFSLSVPQTISDARQAFRNVSSIVRDTISEASRDPSASSTAAGDQMMMAAANTADNEIGGGGSASTTPDPRIAGQTLGKLLGRNYRGLRRLFNSELRSAVKVGSIIIHIALHFTVVVCLRFPARWRVFHATSVYVWVCGCKTVMAENIFYRWGVANDRIIV